MLVLRTQKAEQSTEMWFYGSTKDAEVSFQTSDRDETVFVDCGILGCSTCSLIDCKQRCGGS